jgi:hypothetical protein
MAPPNEKKGSGLTKKYGPLPVWGWLVVGIVAFYLYKKGSSTSTTGTTSTAGTTPTTASVTLPGGYSYTGTTSGAAGYTQSVLSAAQAATAPGQGTTGTSPGSGAGTPGTTSPAPVTAPPAPVAPAAPVASVAPTVPSVGAYEYGGYEPTAAQVQGAPITALSGATYQYITTPAQSAALAQQGNVYAETSPGVFTSVVGPGGKFTGTPGVAEYQKT